MRKFLFEIVSEDFNTRNCAVDGFLNCLVRNTERKDWSSIQPWPTRSPGLNLCDYIQGRQESSRAPEQSTGIRAPSTSMRPPVANYDCDD
ncbi:hypothetical protein AVEN_185707-1 [Araneus ventricosus]|uniref:Uncharacterized protein n=1 Tax=Araneus ventricosus TaxID=182803 RepID=A0A4Y2JH21_ARAVE|nr:hypothetical protein AVEN_185707-1 [Araneus ventricosus]